MMTHLLFAFTQEEIHVCTKANHVMFVGIFGIRFLTARSVPLANSSAAVSEAVCDSGMVSDY